MTFWQRLKHRITGQADDEIERELRDHLDLEAEEQQGNGLNTDDARYAAQRAFGNTALVKEDTRAMWGWNTIERIAQDLRYALRTMRRRPLFTAVAILSLGIGLGANTAVFSFVQAIVMKQLPVEGAERLVVMRQQNEMFRIENCCFPYRFFQELRRQDSGFEDVLALTTASVNLTDQNQTERLEAEVVSGNYFRMLGVRPAVGRLLDEDDDQAEGAGRVCVISHRLWQERFGGDPGIAGRRVLINTEPFQIVGVSEPGFTGAALHEQYDLQIPASMTAVALGDGRDAMAWAQLMARLKPGVSLTQAQQRLNSIGREIQRVTGPKMSERDDFLLYDGSQGFGSRKEQLGKPVQVLLLLVGVVLLAACANLTALLLVRSVERAREAGVRLALGASKTALFRQFLAESVLLAVAGGCMGWIFAGGLTRVLLSLLGTRGEGLAGLVRPDAVVFAFSTATALATGILFGALPAWRAAHAEPLAAVRGTTGGSGRRSLGSRAVIAAQIALSLALLFTAGLFAQTLRNLRSIDLGLSTENVALMRIDLSRTIHRESGASAFFDDLLQRARNLPATRSASLASISVLSGSMQSIILNIPGYVSPNRQRPVTYFTTVSGGYFRTLGIPLLAGRDFTPEDRGSGEGAAIVNEQFARQFFGGDALGKAFSFGGGRKVRVVGIAGTAHYRWIREEPQPVMYVPVTQWSFPQSLFLQVRTAGDASGMIAQLRALVHHIDPAVAVDTTTTMEMQIDQTLARERLLAFLSTLLGAMAVTLAAIGLYGVLSFSVARRTREIGIRVAIGSPRGRILALIFRECGWMVLGGIAMGLPLAFVCGRLASSLLYGLKPQDVLTAVTASALLALVAFAAALLPAWRASRLDPAQALRYE